MFPLGDLGHGWLHSVRVCVCGWVGGQARARVCAWAEPDALVRRFGRRFEPCRSNRLDSRSTHQQNLQQDTASRVPYLSSRTRPPVRPPVRALPRRRLRLRGGARPCGERTDRPPRETKIHGDVRRLFAVRACSMAGPCEEPRFRSVHEGVKKIREKVKKIREEVKKIRGELKRRRCSLYG